MNKTDLIQRLADQHQLSKAEAGRILDTLLDTVVAAVKRGDAVTIPGFGSFKQHARAARNGVNPSTGDKIKIPAAKLPSSPPAPPSRLRSTRRLLPQGCQGSGCARQEGCKARCQACRQEGCCQEALIAG